MTPCILTQQINTELPTSFNTNPVTQTHSLDGVHREDLCTISQHDQSAFLHPDLFTNVARFPSTKLFSRCTRLTVAIAIPWFPGYDKAAHVLENPDPVPSKPRQGEHTCNETSGRQSRIVFEFWCTSPEH